MLTVSDTVEGKAYSARMKQGQAAHLLQHSTCGLGMYGSNVCLNDLDIVLYFRLSAERDETP